MWNSIQICYILRIPELSQGLYLYAIFWYIYSMIHENNWVLHICVLIWLCIFLSVKPSGFQNFLIKNDEPFIKLQIFYMHFFLYISYALLMHFLCTSYALFYALFMHFLEVHKKCIRNACTLNQSTCTSYALLKSA